MIIEKKTDPNFESSGNFNQVDFGLSNRPDDQVMILDILRNNLYIDKISAILREYGCNAFDANVEAGNREKPIEITLPGKMDPTLKIRDFGPGLDKNGINEVYCKYGCSTKRESNAYTGMLGIGSKSGFAYGDSFVINSYVNGTLSIYEAYIDPSRIGKIARLSQQPTDEPNGVEIQIAIRPGDISTVKSRAIEIYQNFQVRPKIHGLTDWVPSSKVIITGDSWEVRKSELSRRGYWAVMGNVAYEISMGVLFNDSQIQRDYDFTTAYFTEVFVTFNIGDLEVSANREGLQYTDKTKKALKERILKAKLNIEALIKKIADENPSLWKKIVHYNKLKTHLCDTILKPLNVSHIAAYGINLWKGKLTKEQESLSRENTNLSETALVYNFLRVSVITFEEKGHNRRRHGRDKSKRVNTNWTYSSERSFRDCNIDRVTVNKVTIKEADMYVAIDKSKGEEISTPQLKWMLSDDSDFDLNVALHIISHDGPDELKTIMEANPWLEHAPWVDYSYFGAIYPERVLNPAPRESALGQVLILRKRNNNEWMKSKAKENWNEVTMVDPKTDDQQRVYVLTKEYMPTSTNGMDLLPEPILDNLYGAGVLSYEEFQNFDLFGWRWHNKDKAPKNWIELSDYVYQKMKEHLASKQLQKLTAFYDNQKNQTSALELFTRYDFVKSSDNIQKPIRQFLIDWKEYKLKSRSSAWDSINEIKSIFKYNDDRISSLVDKLFENSKKGYFESVSKDYENLIERYPLLKVDSEYIVEGIGHENGAQLLVEYIEARDLWLASQKRKTKNLAKQTQPRSYRHRRRLQSKLSPMKPSHRIRSTN